MATERRQKLIDRLQELLQDAAKDIFIPEYVEQEDPDILSAETLGRLMSDMLIDGEEVGRFFLRATYAGLEEHNWHSDAKVFYNWSEEMLSGKQLHEVIECKKTVEPEAVEVGEGVLCLQPLLFS